MGAGRWAIHSPTETFPAIRREYRDERAGRTERLDDEFDQDDEGRYGQ